MHLDEEESILNEGDDETDEPSERGNRGSYDFETREWTKPFALGVGWGPKGNRSTWYDRDSSGNKPREFTLHGLELMHRISEEEKLKHLWAHNGGKFDVLALTEAAYRGGWRAEFRASVDGRVLEAAFQPPSAHPKSHKLLVRDSLCIVQSRLKHKTKDLDCAGKCPGCCVCDFNLPRYPGIFDEEYAGDMFRVEPSRLKAGCIADVLLVLELLDRVETFAEQWGAKLGLTFSQTSLGVVKSFLARDGVALPDFGGRNIGPENQQSFNQKAADAYCGGRVEPYHHSPEGPITELDVTSSYPWAMTQWLPWHFLGAAPDVDAARAVLLGKDGLEGVINAEVNVPHKMWIPPLPIKLDDGAMFFPTGRFEGWWPANELRYARTLGVQVKVKGALAFTRAKPFENFVHELFELKRTSIGAARLFYKLVLNAAYGKWAQRPVREQILLCASSSEAFFKAEALNRRDSFADYLLRSKKVQLGRANARCVGQRWATGGRAVAWDTERWPKHTHFALAAYITGYSRILLHQGMMRAGKSLYYVDTDAVHFDTRVRRRFADVEGSRLGEWKLELEAEEGAYFASKIYGLVESLCPTGKRTGKNCEQHRHGHLHLAAKGFPVDPQNFERLIHGEEARRWSMQLLKTQLAGAGDFERIEQVKTWRGFSRKRNPASDGTTTPWAYETLLSKAHEKAESPGRFRARTGKLDLVLASSG